MIRCEVFTLPISVVIIWQQPILVLLEHQFNSTALRSASYTMSYIFRRPVPFTRVFRIWIHYDVSCKSDLQKTVLFFTGTNRLRHYLTVPFWTCQNVLLKEVNIFSQRVLLHKCSQQVQVQNSPPFQTSCCLLDFKATWVSSSSICYRFCQF